MKKIKIKLAISGLLLAGSLSTWAQTSRINIPVKGLYPEGTVYQPAGKLFYVSSVIDGTIGTVDAQGNYKKIFADKSLKSTYGMKIDPKLNRLWVCVADANYSAFSDSSTYKKMGRVIAIDLKNNKKVMDVNLAALYQGKHFINDLCFDSQGNAYITDSFSPVIYKIDAAGKASVFAENELFKGEDVALNGIVVHPDGYLLVDNGSSGALLKVDLANPKQVSKVIIPQFFTGADGLLLQDANTLILIQNKGVDKVFKISTKDAWKSAVVAGATAATDRFQQPSTGTAVNGQVYVLNSKLNELADKTKKPSPSFSLQLAVFKP